jgi:DNA polymerase-4
VKLQNPNRILHVDGDSFFASCEIALNPKLQGRPVWVGGGRHGDGIVIAANRAAKNFGIKTGMACFEAKKLCPRGVLCRPHYDDYRELSRRMFQVLEEYSPTLVPISIDEGFLDFTTMHHHVWRHTTPSKYVEEIRERIMREVSLPVSAGLASSSRLAKLATDAAKPGFIEIAPGAEKDFLKDRPVRELSGIAKRRERSLSALGARTFGEVAKLPSHLLRKKFGIWGQQLWLFSNGLWSEPLILKVQDRTTISSATTLPYDEPDYEAALTFALSEMTRLVGQLRREQLQARELGLTIRFNDFTEVSGGHRFREPQFLNSVINAALETIFREVMSEQDKPVRQIRVALWNLPPAGHATDALGRTHAERWAALDGAAHELNEQFGKPALMTGAQLALRSLDDAHKNPKAKCPFVPQREMIKKLWARTRTRLPTRPKRKSAWRRSAGIVSAKVEGLPSL